MLPDFLKEEKSVALYGGGGVNIPKISRIKKYKLETLNKKTRKYFLLMPNRQF